MLFSQRHGYKPIREQMQIESIDDDLRNGIWNCFDTTFIQDYSRLKRYYDAEKISHSFFRRVWFHFLKQPTDTLYSDMYNNLHILRKWFFNATWFEIYDFIEFLAKADSTHKCN